MHPGSPSYGQPPQGGASAPPSYPHHPPPQHPSSPQANAYYPPHQQSQFPPGPYGSYPPPAGGAPVPPGQLQYPTYNNQQGHGASPPNQTQYPGYPPQQPSGYQTSLQQQHPPSPPYVYQQPPSPPQAYQQPPVYQQQQPPPATLGYSLPPPPPAQAQAQVQGQVPPAPQAVVVPHGLVPNNNLIQNGPIGGYQPLNAGGAIISTVPAPISHESNVLNTTLAGGGGVDPRLTGVAPPSVVEIHFKCVNLKKSDLFSKSDPFLVIYLQESRLQPMQQLQNGWREIGRTETIKNSQDPIFSKSFQFEYFFEQVQRLRIEVFDRDSDSEQLKDHDFLGMIEITLGQLMGAKGQSMVLALLNAFGKKNNINGEGKCGHIVLSAEEMSSCSQMIGIKFSGNKLDNKNSLFGEKAPSFLGASDPFLNIYKKSTINHQQNQMDWILVWRSNVQMNTLNPRWKEVILPIQLLCNGDTTRPLKIECMDWEKNGQHQLIGSIETTVQDLRQGKTFELIHEKKKQKKKKYKHSGILILDTIRRFKEHTFLEYLRGGCEICLIVGIDYTASNGPPNQPNSLHYQVHQGHQGQSLGQFVQMNEYQAAIQAVGTILEPYDYDKKFPVYGFGGIVNGITSHCFPLNFDPTHPEVSKIEGILQVYGNSFQFVNLSGPTFFAPLIQQASLIAQQFSSQQQQQTTQKYFVLLIITDGVIMDMQPTIDAIVAASFLPLSIVIVGVGNADFSDMDALDGDGLVLVDSRRRAACRDIVQFVPFNKYRNDPLQLSKQTLAEIPTQLVQYMKSKKIVPNEALCRENTAFFTGTKLN